MMIPIIFRLVKKTFAIDTTENKWDLTENGTSHLMIYNNNNNNNNNSYLSLSLWLCATAKKKEVIAICPVMAKPLYFLVIWPYKKIRAFA